MNTQSALTTLPEMNVQFANAIQNVKWAHDLVRQMRADKVLVEGTDYGKVPGTDKDILLKPGAEKLTRGFNLCPKFVSLDAVTRFETNDPLFYFRYECQLYDIETGKLMATGIGSCNSMESKYGQRWVSEAAIPSHLHKSDLPRRDGILTEPEFAIEKGETTGKYGKPTEYWKAFRAAIANGTAKKGNRNDRNGKAMTTWEIGGEQFAIPNADIFSQTNTIDKMAQKRAMIAAVLIATNASEFFTQDVEDMPGFGFSEYIEAEIVPPDSLTSTAPKATSEPRETFLTTNPTPPGDPWGPTSIPEGPIDGNGYPIKPAPTTNGHTEPPKPIDTAKHNAGVFLKHWENEGMSQAEVLTRLGVKRLSDFGNWADPQTAIDADWKMSEYHPPTNDTNMAAIDKALAKLPKNEATPSDESNDKKIQRWSKKWTNSTECAPMLTGDDLLSALYVTTLDDYPWHWNEKDTDPAADKLVTLYVAERATPKSETAKA